MPNRPQHSEKMKSCVEQVMEKGHTEQSAYAICTVSLQKAGEPIFEGAEARSAEEAQWLDESPFRTCTIKPINDKWALFSRDLRHLYGTYTTKCEARKREREVVAAMYPGEERIAEARSLHLLGATGTVRTEIYEGRPHFVVPVVALMEGVIHAVNAATPEFVPLATLEKAAATWNGRPIVLGHPVKDGRQCSANSPDILAAHGLGTIFKARVEGKKLLCEAWIDQEKARRLHPAMYDRLLAGKSEEVSVGAFVVTDDRPGEFNGKAYKASWLETVGDHLAFLPDGRGACSLAMGCGTHRAAMRVCGEKFKRVEDCPVCKGSGNTGNNPCDACDGTGEMREASITMLTAESVNGNSSTISVPAIPTSGSKTPQLKAAGCGCPKGAKIMEKSTRAELIAALVTDRYSGFKDGDESILEGASDARLEEFRSASDARKTSERAYSKLETDFTNTTARLKVAEERLKAAEQNPSEEEWLSKAPPSIKTLLDARKAEEDALRASLVSQLKDLGANTEAELKAKSIDELRTLAAYARVEVPDFSGRGLPVERHAQVSNDNYIPPDPYAAALKSLQGQKAN